MIKLYRDFHAESHGKDLINFDADATIQFLDEMIENPNENFAVVCKLGDDIIGFYMGSLNTMSFSTTPIGFERGFYVRKESRGSRAPEMLKQAFFDWLEKLGVKPAIATIYHSDNNEQTYQFCEKMGMREVGRVFERIL